MAIPDYDEDDVDDELYDYEENVNYEEGEIGDAFDGEVGFDGDADDDAELHRVLQASADEEFERALAQSLVESEKEPAGPVKKRKVRPPPPAEDEDSKDDGPPPYR
jgi:hypothetical protein